MSNEVDHDDDDSTEELPARGVHSQSRHRRSARSIALETIERLRKELQLPPTANDDIVKETDHKD
ncbi:hypothetical protein Psta_0412 [Pirellula staleyi DSM 6068]|uniref:Uncharacterized protein n=1 Tax=Pirellula staleyi (strain ATCC 27377 / DSM 6068 / ICPB 4128) TaxID=530564 RepID=D2R371_PIRSD|nr:hypothetical protein Psta_0412 [Pirellula staleyi DSM 6068]